MVAPDTKPGSGGFQRHVGVIVEELGGKNSGIITHSRDLFFAVKCVVALKPKLFSLSLPCPTLKGIYKNPPPEVIRPPCAGFVTSLTKTSQCTEQRWAQRTSVLY